MRDFQEKRFREIFRRAHAGHAACRTDEWLMSPCTAPDGSPVMPLVWSRRNGPWRRVETLWVGAAPGNAGGKGRGDQGAHGTRIQFGGDIAGANLDALLGSIGIDRNDTFLVAALNRLPDAGGGEPGLRELQEPVGAYPSSIELLRDTVVAAGPGLIITLGIVGLRTLASALTQEDLSAATLPTLCRLERAGFKRDALNEWPAEALPLSEAFLSRWKEAWGEEKIFVLPLMHPSGQNMSPYARIPTAFHQRMVITRDALRRAYSERFRRPVPATRAPYPDHGIYALPEWRLRVGPRHRELDALWRAKGI